MGNKKVSLGICTGLVGRIGSRNKRPGDKKTGPLECKSDGNFGNEKGFFGS